MTSPALDVWPSILTDYTYDSELDNADGVPHSVSTQRLVPSGNQGYIRNPGRYLCTKISQFVYCSICVDVYVTSTFLH